MLFRPRDSVAIRGYCSHHQLFLMIPLQKSGTLIAVLCWNRNVATDETSVRSILTGTSTLVWGSFHSIYFKHSFNTIKPHSSRMQHETASPVFNRISLTGIAEPCFSVGGKRKTTLPICLIPFGLINGFLSVDSRSKEKTFFVLVGHFIIFSSK